MVFKLESIAFNDNESIPKKYTCDGENLSPPLKWKNPPKGTKSFVLIMDAPDAPQGIWDHWVIYNLPSETNTLSEGVRTKELPTPAKLALNSWNNKNYGGPCPPHNSEHTYYFKLYALRDLIKPEENRESKTNIEKTIQGRLLGKAVLIGKYARSAATKETIPDNAR